MPPTTPTPVNRDEAPSRPPVRERGDACPGALRLHSADDGRLARLRLPAGILTHRQAQVLAEAAERLGDGHLDITSRGNIQLRGLAASCGDELGALLDEAGLLPSPEHERVRNIVASPLCGLDGSAAGDAQSWARELDALLCASPAATALSGRFLFALDDGRGDVAALGADVTLLARGDGAVTVHTGANRSGVRVAAADAPRAALLAAETFLTLAAASGSGAWRVRELPPGPGRELDGAVARALARAGIGAPGDGGSGGFGGFGDGTSADGTPGDGGSGGFGDEASADGAPGDGTSADGGPGDGGSGGFGDEASADGGTGDGASADGGTGDGGSGGFGDEASADGAPGDGTSADGAPGDGTSADGPAWPRSGPPAPGPTRSPDGTVALSVYAPLGRLSAGQWRLLLSAGAGGVRVTPWRGVVVPDLDPAAADALLDRLRTAGLITDAGSPWHGVGACTGRPGCAKALADVRADAAGALPAPGGRDALPVYWSGCERRCGHPGGAWVDVVATAEGAYTVSVHDVREVHGPTPVATQRELAETIRTARKTTTTATTAVTK
ncbi:cobalamin biosynthesis protein CobG [Streptomyces sp. NPDC087850]|uniref:cobalamin biosynthesis protein CobG n=1 Tax=Streptomyces sp. NPDC087850 TaxID=3365809 RepID=UPI0037FB653A